MTPKTRGHCPALSPHVRQKEGIHSISDTISNPMTDFSHAVRPGDETVYRRASRMSA
jgi:hypothetical protein